MLLDLQTKAVEGGELDLDDAGKDGGPLLSDLDAISTQHGRGIAMLAEAERQATRASGRCVRICERRTT